MSRIFTQLTLGLFLGCLTLSVAQANEPRLRGYIMQRDLGIRQSDLADHVPVDPFFRPVDFFKLPEPGDLRERIERLTHGAYVDIPPKYDYYGYSIRRFMSRVGSPAALSSKDNIKGQITNIEHAQNVLGQWRQAVYEEIDIIDEIRENDPKRAASVGSLYKYNTGRVKAFFLEAQSWLRSNKAFLEFLYGLEESGYDYQDPIFIFRTDRDLKRFNTLYGVQQKALKQIQTYPPFRMMIY